jgi:hypothetical protein
MGLSWVEFNPPGGLKANLPFNGMMQFFAALLKEIPTALFALVSNS